MRQLMKCNCSTVLHFPLAIFLRGQQRAVVSVVSVLHASVALIFFGYFGLRDGMDVAGSLAVEMCCGVIQHPQGVRAPAACHDPDASSSSADSALPLGPVPHMVRQVHFSHYSDSAACRLCAANVLICVLCLL